MGDDGYNRLMSALASPQNQATYGDADLFTQAAYLLGKVAAAHGYENGNKRTALALTDLFLQKNGYLLSADRYLEDLIVSIVEANSNQVDPEPLYETLTVALKDRCGQSHLPPRANP